MCPRAEKDIQNVGLDIRDLGGKSKMAEKCQTA
jgi:hypothetical protein